MRFPTHETHNRPEFQTLDWQEMDGEGSGGSGESDGDADDDARRVLKHDVAGRGRSWRMGRGGAAVGRGVANGGGGRGWRSFEDGPREGRAAGPGRVGRRMEWGGDEEPASVRRLDPATESALPVLTAELEGGDGFGG